jgi:hypothetical protein
MNLLLNNNEFYIKNKNYFFSVINLFIFILFVCFLIFEFIILLWRKIDCLNINFRLQKKKRL